MSRSPSNLIERAWAALWHRTVWTAQAWFYSNRFTKPDWLLLAVIGATLGTIIGLGVSK